MSTAEKSPADLNAVPDHLAVAMLTNRRNSLDRTFEAVEGMVCAPGDYLKALVVFVATDFAFSHKQPFP